MVLGPDGKRFKTRSGDTVRLKDLLNEGVDSAKLALEARNSNVEVRVAQCSIYRLWMLFID